MSKFWVLEKMRDTFLHLVRTESLYCKDCASVGAHRVLSRNAYPAREGIPAHIPLLCECGQCGSLQMLCSQEFAAFSPSLPDDTLCKVLGRGQLLAGDWVYVPGRPRPGRVKAVFRVQGQETVVISYADGAEERVSRTLGANDSAENPAEKLQGYRLLPFQVAQTRLGDAVFHVQRESFGRAVGLLFGRESKLVVQLESQVLLFTTLPESAQIPDNASLTRLVREQCVVQFAGSLPATLQINAAQGMVYLQGASPDLATLRVVRSFCAALPFVRAVVDNVSVEPSQTLSDDQLEIHVHALLVTKGIPLIRSCLQCQRGHLTLSGVYRHESIPEELQNLLETEPLRGLTLDLSFRPSEDPADKNRSQAVNLALRKFSRLQGARIRATSLDGVVFLEGIVQSSLQKNQATLAAMIAGRNLRVENHLRVVRSATP